MNNGYVKAYVHTMLAREHTVIVERHMEQMHRGRQKISLLRRSEQISHCHRTVAAGDQAMPLA
jgi:hypothetical protein